MLWDVVHEPIVEYSAVYDQLYKEYSKLHDDFRQKENDVLKGLNGINKDAKSGKRWRN